MGPVSGGRMKPLWTRRRFLQGFGVGIAAAGLLAACGRLGGSRREIPGRICGADAARAHRLRAGGFPAPSRVEQASCVIVGGGIAGLSAAWRLRKAGFEDFVLLELDEASGGNSRGGENAISAYPWGAHYVPLANPESESVLRLFQELGVVSGFDAAGRPRYHELYLCAEPEERLFLQGAWQSGIVPREGLSFEERDEMARFHEKMAAFGVAKGGDGRWAFAIPVDLSSRDRKFLALDRQSMAQWLEGEGLRSRPLRWYVDYCCRDDFGTPADQVSAWAGIHYFAGRRGQAANAEPNTVLTWPEGNGWLARRLREACGDRLRCDAVVYKVAAEGSGRRVEYWDARGDETRALRADQVIYAAPRFTAAYTVEEYQRSRPEALAAFHYAPWLVANLSLPRPPRGKGAPLAWDNVLYESPGLGYVVATHQGLKSVPGPTVLTYYRPLDHEAPVAARRAALGRSYAEWREMILEDLGRAHPELREEAEHLDVWLWGHGMIRPEPGFLWGPARAAAGRGLPGLHFAHSDMSGMSLFEEAHERGIAAADAVLKSLGKKVPA
ncbi:FAD-dependent oxidoreductase [Deltaproteobacteria bacterium PRO3]|nr:FAD-dependent oxidoreductase [Deltaproteobacteria bacterium PRO3]